jgi:hypothetical protein
MSGIGEVFIGYEQKQQSAYSFVDTMSEINRTNITNRNTNHWTIDPMSDLEYTALSYKISLGLICACLCLLTITGNLLVLITFRRIRTVSTRIFNTIDI